MGDLPKTYDPGQVEKQISQFWELGNYFHAQPDQRGPQQRFSVVIPPPNVTGALHLGHGLNNTLQDILVRWHRMQGHNTLWMPGTDHAGIATQAVVEKRLKEQENLSRHDIGRDALVQRIWHWKDQYETRIIHQLKQMGCSCDFARTRFTLDDGCSRAVRETFFRLFKDGYIVRGKRLVNWDCELQTAVADDEVYHEQLKGKFYHFRYPIKDNPTEFVVIATTRPETMLGDTAVAVNPGDARYQHLVGKTILLPLMNREIPVIADEWADPELGSGCVKITPAHDPNDYAVWQRHPRIECINILNPDGTINENGGKYCGKDRFVARHAVLEDLEKLELIEKIEDRVHDVGHSDRSKTPIEPYLSDQWFMKMDTELSERTLDAVRNGDVRFHPQRYQHAYLDWLGEKRDWCISRQLWWGHRIPVWTIEVNAGEAHIDQYAEQLQALQQVHGADKLDFKWFADEDNFDRQDWGSGTQSAVNITWAAVLREDDPAIIAALEALNMEHDPDVLDTWFSSALWPHSTLGWPDHTPELEYYYPTSVLSTARDIISLWVVRMVLTGLYNVGSKPFDDVYIHPKILDGRGVTMSKSKGNGVDPMDIIEAFGADALRFGMAAITTETQDIRMPVEYRCPHCNKLTPQNPKNMFGADGSPSKVLACSHCRKEFATRWANEDTQQSKGLALMVSDKFEAARNFINKLWNAARFAFMHVRDIKIAELQLDTLPPEDRWILSELSQVVREVQSSLSRYQFSRATLTARNFFWDALCDWYLELVKFRVNQKHHADAARQVLAFCLDQLLRLLHPIIPFVTERLWSQLNDQVPTRGLPGIVELDHTAALTVAAYPPRGGFPQLEDPQICQTFHDLQDAARSVREVRSAAGIAPKQQLRVTIKTTSERGERLAHEAHILREMAGIEDLLIDPSARREPGSAIKLVGDLQIFVHDAIDDTTERARVEKEIAGLEKRMRGMEGKLSNEGYVRSAPPEVVEQTRQLLDAARLEHQTFESILNLLN